MDTITPEYETIEIETPGRRRKITKFALAGVAVLGVGAALTSAAWTDNVWFGGDAESTGIDLVGSLTGPSDPDAIWNDGTIDQIDGSFDLEMATMYLGPEQTSTQEVWVRNDSDIPVRLSEVSAEGTLGVFAMTDPAGQPIPVADDLMLDAGEATRITVSVTAPDWSDDDTQTVTGGRIVLHVEATTDLVGP